MGLKYKFKSKFEWEITVLKALWRRPRVQRAYERGAHFICDESVSIGDFTPHPLLFSTDSGLFHYDGAGTVRKLFEGHCYGIAQYDDRWYFTRTDRTDSEAGLKWLNKEYRTSYIYSFRLVEHRPKDIELIARGLPNEIHQIDVYDGTLIVPYTSRNLMLFIPTAGHALWPWEISHTKLSGLRKLSHLNSIYGPPGSGKWLVLAHNNTVQTGIPSEILECDEGFGITSITTTSASAAHNIFKDEDGHIWINDSANGRLLRDDKTVIEPGIWLRGMAANDNQLFVGGSRVTTDRGERHMSDATLISLTRRELSPIMTTIPGIGPVNEIRLLEGDLAMTGTQS